MQLGKGLISSLILIQGLVYIDLEIRLSIRVFDRAKVMVRFRREGFLGLVINGLTMVHTQKECLILFPCEFSLFKVSTLSYLMVEGLFDGSKNDI